MRIGAVDVFVDDQDKARAFYTAVLGFQLKTDMPYSDTARWLTVVSPDDPGGTQLSLTPATAEARALQEARRASGAPTISLTTDDCHAAHAELVARGAVFRFAPRTASHGIDAVLEDGCGNLLNLHQEQ